MGLIVKILLVTVAVAFLAQETECRAVSRSGGSRSRSGPRSPSWSAAGGSSNRIKTSDDGHGSAGGGVSKTLNPSRSDPNLGKDSDKRWSKDKSVDHVYQQPHRSHVNSRRHHTDTTTEKPKRTTPLDRQLLTGGNKTTRW